MKTAPLAGDLLSLDVSFSCSQSEFNLVSSVESPYSAGIRGSIIVRGGCNGAFEDHLTKLHTNVAHTRRGGTVGVRGCDIEGDAVDLIPITRRRQAIDHERGREVPLQVVELVPPRPPRRVCTYRSRRSSPQRRSPVVLGGDGNVRNRLVCVASGNGAVDRSRLRGQFEVYRL